MGVQLTIEAEGLEQIAAIMAGTISSTSKVRGVELHGGIRQDSKATNGEILWYLAEAKESRDVVNLQDAEAEEVAEAFALEYDRRVQRILNKGALVNKLAILEKIDLIVGSAYRAAMRKYMTKASDHIVNSTDVHGRKLESLSRDYAERKSEEFGFEEPILVATGQIIEALSPETAAKNIKLIK